jgi:hypothetical protein
MIDPRFVMSGTTAQLPVNWRVSLLGHRALFAHLDTDLASLYEVETRTLVQAVKRNAGRFPEDFSH